MDPQNKPTSSDLDKLLPIAHVEHKEIFNAGNFAKFITAVIAVLIIITSTITVFMVSSLKSKIDQKSPVKLAKKTATPKPSTSVQEAPGSGLTEANWKIFTNNTYGYSIKYPQSWITTPIEILDQQSPEKQDMSISFLDNNTKSLTINAYSIGKFNNVSLLEFIDLITAPSDLRIISSQKNIKIGKLDGLKQNVDFQDSALSGIWYVTKNCDHYFTFVIPAEYSSEDVETALSTFNAVCANPPANGF